MDIHQVRLELSKGTALSKIHLRAVYYARVSTEKDEQLNSLNNQQIFYENYIRLNECWTFAGAYVDEGLSGMTTAKRENFLKMISDAKDGKFDIIITKEITRFARNTLDSIHFTRELLNDGVAVLFQNDNINTIEIDSELRLTIMSAIAQEEVRRLSSRIKFGHAQAIKNGVVMGNSRIYGFDKEKGKLVINQTEAPMIRMIFNLYATGEYTTPKIERILWEKGYRNRNGEMISRTVIGHIIINPKYKGYYCGNKVKIEDMFTKKQKFLPKEDWLTYRDEDSVPAIVDENTWEQANEHFRIRSETIKGSRTSIKPNNLFTGKLICEEHNTPFWLKARVIRGKSDNTWVCSHRIKNGKDSCDTFGIKESELMEILTDVLIETTSEIDKIIDKYVNFLKKTIKNDDITQKRVNEVKALIESEKAKKERLLDFSMEDIISKKEFKERNSLINQKIFSYEDEITEINEKERNNKSIISDIVKFKSDLLKYTVSDNKILTPSIVNKFIDRIVVTPNSDTNGMNLKIYLKTGLMANKSVSCSDNMVKVMIET